MFNELFQNFVNIILRIDLNPLGMIRISVLPKKLITADAKKPGVNESLLAHLSFEGSPCPLRM